MSYSLPDLDDPFFWGNSDSIPWIDFKANGGGGAFSTRLGGASKSPYDTLNVGIFSKDDAGLVEQNLSSVLSSMGRDRSSLAFASQQHGSQVYELDDGWAQPEANDDAPKADGLVSASTASTLMVVTADCIPMALVAPGAVAMVHCGWRGVADSFVGKSVAALAASAGRTDLSDVAAYLGPSIGRCCYEVDSEVAGSLGVLDGNDLYHNGMLDLAGVVARDLAVAGIKTSNIFSVGLCTNCWFGLFFSHRRSEGESGRQGGFVWRA